MNTNIALFVAILSSLPLMPWHGTSPAISWAARCISNPAARKPNRDSCNSLSPRKDSLVRSRWKAQLGKLPEAERDELLFMLGARWADDIAHRTKPRAVCQSHGGQAQFDMALRRVSAEARRRASDYPDSTAGPGEYPDSNTGERAHCATRTDPV